MKAVSDIALVKACLKGDREAQQCLYENHKNTLFRLCLRYADTREEAEDWLQDGFVQCFRDLKQFRGGSLEGWLRKVQLRIVLQALRRKPSRPSTVSAEFAPEAIAENANLFQQLDGPKLLTLLQALPSGYRTVFNLYVLEELSHSEIAEALGISPNTSKSQLHKAKQQLQVLVRTQFPDLAELYDHTSSK